MMDSRIASPARPRLFVAIFATVVAPIIAMGASLHAQTLLNPNPPTRAPAAAQTESKPLKSCPTFGPGFVQVPGSNTCVKVGGGVQVQGSAH